MVFMGWAHRNPLTPLLLLINIFRNFPISAAFRAEADNGGGEEWRAREVVAWLDAHL